MSGRSRLIFIMLLWAAMRAQAAPLHLCFEDVPQPPWTMPDGSGLNISLLKLVEKQLGEQFVFVAKPWKRCLEEVRSGALDGIISAADSPERRSFSVAPTLADGRADPDAALCEDRFNVFLRKAGPGKWDGRLLSSPAHSVVVQTGYIVADLLRQRGVAVNDSVKSAEAGLRLLAEGFADVAVLQGYEAERLVESDPRFAGKIALAAPPYEVLPLYLLISRKTHAANPGRIDAIWAAIRSQKASPAYRSLLPKAEQRSK
ncbi:substrate-binding periplasmic protein [Chitinimonas sp.]|uniref:substrate-binding periplasmic protein n=1 Tax=Chitinimonas sp. TaxID=1934313 RepID=UPI0035B0AB92